MATIQSAWEHFSYCVAVQLTVNIGPDILKAGMTGLHPKASHITDNCIRLFTVICSEYSIVTVLSDTWQMVMSSANINAVTDGPTVRFSNLKVIYCDFGIYIHTFNITIVMIHVIQE
jgi:hypothetical protein